MVTDDLVKQKFILFNRLINGEKMNQTVQNNDVRLQFHNQMRECKTRRSVDFRSRVVLLLFSILELFADRDI